MGTMGALKNIEKPLVFIAFPALGGPWAFLGGPWEVSGESLGVPGRPWDDLGWALGPPWALAGGSLGALGSPGEPLGSLGGVLGGPPGLRSSLANYGAGAQGPPNRYCKQYLKQITVYW